ncbi:DegT/DnrJ/EryC1/StrS family aminotransferase [Ekhidna sp.]|uniref:DegT/DnrJ/EryC1/StrS family aminotransferase n=1 Tax=Ekhidna sp. TaxID=2608089 RepID=UPI003B509457
MSELDIKMVDLVGQTNKIRKELELAINDVIDGSQYIKGPSVTTFEENLGQFLNSKHVISCGNGTDALQVALMALNLEEGDEIIVPSFTYVASAEVIALLGLNPVFVDVDPKTFNINVEQLENLISNRTKAIIPVHLYGQGANMDAIMSFAKSHDFYVVEDTAQAIACPIKVGLEFKTAGTIGDIGTLSFFPSKNLGCFGDGGAILVQDDDLANRVRKLANHGQKSKYEFELVGCNSRLDSMQAAILDVKLKYLKDYINERQKVASYYDGHLAELCDIEIPFRDKDSGHVFHQYTIKVEAQRRNEFIAYLKDAGVPTQIYYPIPIHMNEAYEYLGYKGGDLPITEKLSESVFSLPMHTELSQNELDYIVQTIHKFLK